jgi:hypothetical protein
MGGSPSNVGTSMATQHALSIGNSIVTLAVISVTSTMHHNLVALERTFQNLRLDVRNQYPAPEFAKYLEEARLVAVVELAMSDFELGDDVNAHGLAPFT